MLGTMENAKRLVISSEIMKIIENNILPPKGYRAITLLNCIFVRRDIRLTASELRHETIHLLQEKELLFVGFYLLYGLEYLVRLALYRNRHLAYRNISFEREAYAFQNELGYTDYRKHYTWVKFILKEKNK